MIDEEKDILNDEEKDESEENSSESDSESLVDPDDKIDNQLLEEQHYITKTM